MSRTLASITCLLCVSAIAHAADVEALDLEPIAVSLSTTGDSGGVDYKDDYQDTSDCSCKSKVCGCDCICPIVPSMIGDGGLITPLLQFGLPDVTPAFQNHIYKVAENNSPLPQDRIGFNYNFLHNVYNGTLDGLRVNDDLSEYRLFAEKTLFCDRLSVDLMIPFYFTSRYDPGDDLLLVGPETDYAFGDIAFGMKYLLHRSESAALSAGLRVEAPTNDEITQTGQLNFFYATVNDDVWHFTPYAALLMTPSDRFFVQSFLSYRLNSGSLESEEFGPIRQQTYLMADASAGYWIYRNPGNRGLTGIVPTVELHYTGAFDEESPDNTVTNTIYGKTDVLNLTAGLTALINDRTSMAVGVSVPLLDNPTSLPFTTSTVGTDRRYDWALMVNMNYYFGR